MSDKEGATRELDDTIRRLAPALGLEPGEMFGAWALVGHIVSPANEEESHYLQAYSTEDMPTHAAIGLFRMAQLNLER